MSILNNRYGDLSKPNKNRELEDGYRPDSLDYKLISYHKLWRTLGFLGLFIPLTLIILSAFRGENLLPSISHYHYSKINFIFIGAIFSIALFLWNYEGEVKYEGLIAKIASISIFCVMVLPTEVMPEYLMDTNYIFDINDFKGFVSPTPSSPEFISIFHYICAAIFFICLSLLILIFFVKSEKKSDNLKNRIIIFRVCGFGILILILAIFLISICIEGSEKWPFPATFTLESLSLALFGVAWLVKGKLETTLDFLTNLGNSD